MSFGGEVLSISQVSSFEGDNYWVKFQVSNVIWDEEVLIISKVLRNNFQKLLNL